MADEKPRKPFRDAEGSIIRKEIQKRTHTGRTKTEIIYYSRVRYTDLEGKRREKKRVCDSYNDAITKRRELRDDIAKELDPANNLEEKPKTFAELADYYEENYVKPAVFVKDNKVEGFREDIQTIKTQLNLFRQYFGTRLLKHISYEDIRQFKLQRIAAPVVIVKKFKIPVDKASRPSRSRRQFVTEKREVKSERSIASVNRDLSRLRGIFYVAVRKQWLAEHPFLKGDPLVKTSEEVVRVRVLSPTEEKLLYSFCTDRSAHLKNIIAFAIDTFMRSGEITKLTWAMVDIQNRRINIPAKITKTLKARTVPMSLRVTEILKELGGGKSVKKSQTVFGVSSFDNPFNTLRTKAGLKDIRIHDLRATGITRLLRKGMEAPEVMKFSGHTDFKTFMKYVRPDDDTFDKATSLMDSFNDENK